MKPTLATEERDSVTPSRGGWARRGVREEKYWFPGLAGVNSLLTVCLNSIWWPRWLEVKGLKTEFQLTFRNVNSLFLGFTCKLLTD